ncbi:hypothetical protein L209DRAFT_397289 [Thermothelomyces heterothallicus CBS 203.75]
MWGWFSLEWASSWTFSNVVYAGNKEGMYVRITPYWNIDAQALSNFLLLLHAVVRLQSLPYYDTRPPEALLRSTNAPTDRYMHCVLS